MAGILSKGIKLGYKESSSATTYTKIPNLQSAPDLGGDVDQVDVTTLENDAYQYINGIKNFGSLEYTFLYDNSGATSNYRVLKGLEAGGSAVAWEEELPDGTKFQFSALPHVKINGAGVNAALQFTLTLALQSDITTVDPVTPPTL